MIDPNRIPLHETEHAPEPIREAAEAWHEAQASHRAARNALGRLDGGRDQARQLDAAESARARRAGKSGTARKHEQQYDRDLDAAEHELRVARALVEQTHADYQQALYEHGPSWREDAVEHAQLVDHAWSDAVEALVTLHADRVSAHARARLLGADSSAGAGAVRLTPAQLVDSITGSRLELSRHDDPAARFRQRVVVRLDDLLAALQTADEPERVEPFMPGGHMADQFALTARHAVSVQRGFSDEEIENNSAPAINRGNTYINGQPVNVYVPGSGEGD